MHHAVYKYVQPEHAVLTSQLGHEATEAQDAAQAQAVDGDHALVPWVGVSMDTTLTTMAVSIFPCIL